MFWDTLAISTGTNWTQYNEGRTGEDGLYNPDSIVGRSGLERLYESDLRGRDGYMIFIRSYEGINQGTLYKKDVQNGYDIKSTFVWICSSGLRKCLI